MSKRIGILLLIASLTSIGIVYAADRYTMKCKDEACGYSTPLTLGPTMMSKSIVGYCRPCKKFVRLSWRYRDMGNAKTEPEKAPKPMGEIWDSTTGALIPVYGCPDCKGPFMEIKKHADLKHCPVCNKPGFSIDTSKPAIAVD